MRTSLPTSILPVMALAVAAITGCGSGQKPAPSEGRDPRGGQLFAEAGTPVKVGRAPVAVALTPGAVWVLDQGDGRLRRVDPQTSRPVGRGVRVGSSPLALAAGESALWVLDGRSGVTRVDPSTGRPLGRPVAVTDPNGIVAGAGGVWVSSRQGRTVTRIDPRTLRPDRPIRVGAGPADLAVSGGVVWVAEADAGAVRRIDPATGAVSPPIKVAEEQVLALAGDEAGVYAAVSKTALNDELFVVRLDPETQRPAGEPVPITGGVPLRLAVGAGSVWTTDVGSRLPGTPRRGGALLRISGEQKRAAMRVASIAGRPSAVAVGRDDVWVTDSTRGTLTRVELG